MIYVYTCLSNANLLCKNTFSVLFDLYNYGLWLVIWSLLFNLTTLPVGTFTSYNPQELDRASLPKHATLFQAFKSDICDFFYMEFLYLPCPSRFSAVDYSLFCMNFVSSKSVKIYYHNFLVFFLESLIWVFTYQICVKYQIKWESINVEWAHENIGIIHTVLILYASYISYFSLYVLYSLLVNVGYELCNSNFIFPQTSIKNIF